MIRPPLEANGDGRRVIGSGLLRQQDLPLTRRDVRARRLSLTHGGGESFDGAPAGRSDNICVPLSLPLSSLRLNGRPVLDGGGRLGSFAVAAGTRISGHYRGEIDFIEFRIPTRHREQLLADCGFRPGCAALREDYLPSDRLFERRIRQLRFALAYAPRFDALYVDTALESCLGHLVRRHGVGERLPERTRPSLPPKALNRVLDFIEANLTGALRLEDLAAVAGISRAHFARAFRNETGLAPHRYVIHRRVDAALNLLRTATIPIARIAALSGFADHAHLAQTFRQQLGMTASQARQLLAGQRAGASA